MSKVAWPSKKDMVKYTIATVVFIIFFALFFYGIILVLGLLKDLIVIL
jgi:preprotein translocase SecE subunit